jgi:hypothetical protein
MKSVYKIIILFVLTAFMAGASFGQNPADTSAVIHKVIKQNGVAFVGKIISQDAREVLIETQDLGLIYIPKHEIREISEIKRGENGTNGELFSTRYFLTTNGFPIKKGDNYVQWNLFGPDFQFGVADNFGVGVMTSWVGLPIIGTAKYSVHFGKNLCGGLGFLGGTGSWAYPKYGLLLPFGFLTIGSRTNNINISAGYGAIFAERSYATYVINNIPTDFTTNSFTETTHTINDSEGRPLMSVAGTFRLNSKFSFVFDSFIMFAGKDRVSQVLLQTDRSYPDKSTYFLQDQVEKRNPLIVLVPGLRFQATGNSSFQFGFTGVHFDGEFVPFPIPMVQWFRKI